jgi:RNA polymerase sigma factor (sigma-70 family)
VTPGGVSARPLAARGSSSRLPGTIGVESNRSVGRGPTIGRAEIEALYRQYGALVRRRARRLLGDELEAQDALQEVFVRVLGAMNEFRGASQPSTWLYRITTNLCLNRLRDGRRRRERLAEVSDAGPAYAPAPAPEARTLLRRMLADLDGELAEIAVYYHVDEMDQAEIAGLLGVSRRTIGYRLERFLEEAQRLLADGAVAPAAPAGVERHEERPSAHLPEPVLAAANASHDDGLPLGSRARPAPARRARG